MNFISYADSTRSSCANLRDRLVLRREHRLVAELGVLLLVDVVVRLVA